MSTTTWRKNKKPSTITAKHLHFAAPLATGALVAVTLNNIGTVYDSLGEKQKALDYYSQALSIIRALGDREGGSATLHNIGKVYESLGEKQKALDYIS
jgi:tetratricopeptide (TPR) repeat protein